MNSFEKLKNKLAELFQLDQADLDFGIYRIMNSRRDEINKFLESDLLPQVRDAFGEYRSSDKVEIQKELNKVIEGVNAAGMDPELSPKVKELRTRLAEEAVDISALENEVYDHLCSFFSRYYDEGDFISLRRYKEGVYAIPYEGEEVKLHWANHDQYYIKTTEYFHDYTFKTADDHRVHFKIVEADTEKDNIKSTNGNDRRFLLHGDLPVAEEDSELVIRFEYRPDGEKRRQDAINADIAERVNADLDTEKLAIWKKRLGSFWKRSDGSSSDKSSLEKHLSDYTKRNTFDYFIHKDLDGFLRRELDFYIKNEVMRLDDIEEESAARVEQYLSKIKVIRRIAHKIIDFLKQIENFQKKLWLKKKFVVETKYCITLDRVPEELYPEITTNEGQREEWVKLFAINEIRKDLVGSFAYSEPMSEDFLKSNNKLVLDTRYFNEEFKLKLIASIDDLDDQCDGVLIHSENFQALNAMRNKFKGKIECVYIDPPYNTDASPILYKNNYMRSSWLGLVENRLDLTNFLLRKQRHVLSIAIDDKELSNLCKLLEIIYHPYEIQKVVVNHYPGSGSGRANVSRTHEYCLFVIPIGLDILKGEAKEEGIRERAFRRAGTGENNFRTGRPNSFYAVLINPLCNEIMGFEPPPIGESYPTGNTTEGWKRIYPIGEDGSERVWTLSYESAARALENGILVCTNQHSINRLYHDQNERNILTSVWLDKKYSAVTYGTNLLTDIFGKSGLFSYPKSMYTIKSAIEAITYDSPNAVVLDYFAGSGTTGHAVIDLNRSDEGKRRYILVEMGDYFESVLVPRIKKVIYSKDWKDGKPISRVGISHMFKYIRLESYEDALSNIELKRTDPQQLALDKGEANFRESYMLKYLFDVESRGSQTLLNIENFEDPWNYKLLVGAGSVGETKSVKVDLVETFNWLLGLKVKHMDRISDFLVVEGENPKGEKALVIWRKIRDLTAKNTESAEQIQKHRQESNEKLEAFFKKQQYNTLDAEFDVIYVNGDNNLMNVPLNPDKDGVTPRYKVRLIEEEFKRLMFDVEDV